MSDLMNGKQITVSSALSVLFLVGMIVGGVWALDSRYAKAEEMEDISMAIQDVHCEIVKAQIVTLRSQAQYREYTGFDRARWRRLQDRKVKFCNNVVREDIPNGF